MMSQGWYSYVVSAIVSLTRVLESFELKLRVMFSAFILSLDHSMFGFVWSWFYFVCFEFSIQWRLCA